MIIRLPPVLNNVLSSYETKQPNMHWELSILHFSQTEMPRFLHYTKSNMPVKYLQNVVISLFHKSLNSLGLTFLYLQETDSATVDRPIWHGL
jgi:hypothetical protein